MITTNNDSLRDAEVTVESPNPSFLARLFALPKVELTIISICLLFGLLLRLVHISYREFYGTEFNTLEHIYGSRMDFFAATLRGQLPLYYEFIRVWGGWFESSSKLLEQMLRIPSVVFGILTFFAFVAYGQRYLRGTAFLIGLLIFAMNPTLVSTSNSANNYALLGLCSVFSQYYCVRSLDEGGRRNWGLYGLFSVLGIFTHPFFWFLAIGQWFFAIARPRKTPKEFVAIAVSGIVAVVVACVLLAVYAGKTNADQIDITTPVVDDVMGGLVGLIVGDFKRYTTSEFVRALLFLFVIVTLGLSILYYRLRSMEADMVPEHVVWVDETQDVVGQWRRLSLASFLAFQWVTFAVPAVCILLLASSTRELRVSPEHFIVCLPALAILVAAGVDAVPGPWVKGVLGIFLVAVMSVYNVFGLTDKGLGVYDMFYHMEKSDYDPQKDVLIYAYASDAENAIEQYSKGVRGERVSSRLTPLETAAKLDKLTADKYRVYVFYNREYRRFGQGRIAPVRLYFTQNKDKYTEKRHILSRPDGTELVIYKRILDGKAKSEGRASSAVPAETRPSNGTTTTSADSATTAVAYVAAGA